MFDIGWQELFIVGLVTIIVVGPKELPRVLRTITLSIRKIRGMARDFQDGLEELAREADLDEMKKELEASADLEAELERSMDPDGEVSQSIRELEEAIDGPEKPVAALESGPRPESNDAPSGDTEATNAKPGGAA